ncbi:MAG: hypothetical protein QM765_05730, partial [Myxococcales bacterium]
MLELPGDARLAQEALRRLAVDVTQELLEGDLAAEVLVEGDQHPAHAAPALLLAQVVAPGLLAG